MWQRLRRKRGREGRCGVGVRVCLLRCTRWGGGGFQASRSVEESAQNRLPCMSWASGSGGARGRLPARHRRTGSDSPGPGPSRGREPAAAVPVCAEASTPRPRRAPGRGAGRGRGVACTNGDSEGGHNCAPNLTASSGVASERWGFYCRHHGSSAKLHRRCIPEHGHRQGWRPALAPAQVGACRAWAGWV